MRAYRASLVFLFVRAALETIPGCTVHIKHSLNNGFYGEFEHSQPVIEKDIRAIEERMRELVEEDIPFTREIVSVEEARKIYAEQGFEDKIRLLTSRRATKLCSTVLAGSTILCSILYLWHLKYFKLRLLPAWVYYQYRAE